MVLASSERHQTASNNHERHQTVSDGSERHQMASDGFERNWTVSDITETGSEKWLISHFSELGTFVL